MQWCAYVRAYNSLLKNKEQKNVKERERES